MSALFGSFSRSRAGASADWLGVHAGESSLLGAASLATKGRESRPQIRLMSPAPVPAQSPSLRAWREACPKRVRANVILRSAEYRVLPVEPPEVAPEELREAVRWQMADALDFPAEDAAIDLLTLPSHQANARGRYFLVAAPGEQVTAWVDRCKAADLRLGALDIPEMAMRNLSVLAAGESAHAFLYVGIQSTRMALIWKRELCSFRQLDVSGRQLAAATGEERESLIERLALETQRTADSFSRQFSGVDLDALWLTSVFEPEALADSLSVMVPQRVKLFELGAHVDIESGPASVVDMAQGRDYLLAIGAALRQESG